MPSIVKYTTISGVKYENVHLKNDEIQFLLFKNTCMHHHTKMMNKTFPIVCILAVGSKDGKKVEINPWYSKESCR